MPTVGFLSSLSKDIGQNLFDAFEDALENGLESPRFSYRGTGQTVPSNLRDDEVFICTRWANGVYQALPALAAELRDLKVTPKVIAATGGIVSAKAAEAKTRRIPIVFISGREKAHDHDDHTSNARGVFLDTTKFAVEHIEGHKILRRMGFRRDQIYHLVHSRSVVHDDEKDWTNIIKVTDYDLDEAFNDIMRRGNDIGALLVSADPFFNTKRVEIVNFANNVFRKETCYPWPEYTLAGGLMSWCAPLADSYATLGEWAAEIINKNRTGKQMHLLHDKPRRKTKLTVNRQTAIAQLGRKGADLLLKQAKTIV